MADLNYKAYNDLARDIKANIRKIPSDTDLIVGIPRSGMIPAYMIALALSKPACSINEFLSGDFKNSMKTSFRVTFANNCKNVLIIDDSVNMGDTMLAVREWISAAGLDAEYNIKYATVYYKDKSRDLVDIALCECPQPRMFQWHYLNHANLKDAALDIDGVLCMDPTPEQNDDGDRYIDFILNAHPLYVPQYRVAALVTSRLGQYRAKTVEWLAKHGVEYDELYMLENKTAQQRQEENLHARHKAAVYKKLAHTNIFIESDPRQAREIAALTGKLCFCSQTDELFGSENEDNFRVKKKRPKFHFLRRIVALLMPTRELRHRVRG
jgi:uncharacterized HAD superfamily protein/hypoxanthine-guanine phosphoribosyltransferase